ncbi:MAG: MGMT family protein [bacterium]|nr:MGMT family protein [bacterium]
MPGFKEQVWAALKLIPRGRVATYREVARYLGRPNAARAVGNACGKNPYAPAVPCHRVVRHDGSLGGYAGGVKRKIELLKREKVKISKGKVEELNRKIYKFI